jgi:hypothetical protein
MLNMDAAGVVAIMVIDGGIFDEVVVNSSIKHEMESDNTEAKTKKKEEYVAWQATIPFCYSNRKLKPE